MGRRIWQNAFECTKKYNTLTEANDQIMSDLWESIEKKNALIIEWMSKVNKYIEHLKI